jgi:hypothetical protein
MPALLLAALLNTSDAPLVAAPPALPQTLDLSTALDEPDSSAGARHLMGWGVGLTSAGLTMMSLSAVLFGMLASSSNACSRTRGCIDESGLAYMFAAIPLLVGFPHVAVGAPMLGRGLHLRRVEAAPRD